ncbi:MAG: hypothetical protein H6751_03550 [Candidatus Omnitrophica bacterium]|nr:hypothetical protein [Candidatus Omnitrophota bacterium]MCA9424065.1 hypothetical protein [Candidatus Omnitrophota bacterium]MCA9442280.1 hypothetical protein [Candidatus Omnitrophota bacterium]MCB9770518.1 hypothetical protein [Candidatus Omnitrophota bacterium]MCB9782021.1 hypothetical protein [Candidatus Omnitrophota bacterium]
MRKLAIFSVLLAMAVAPSYAQDIAGTLGFDLVPGAPVFDLSNNVVDDDSDIDTALTVNNGEQFSTLIRLNGAQDLLGVTFDFSFDDAVLNVVTVRETRMDIDFSGDKSFQELNDIVGFFLDEFGSGGDGAVNKFSYTYDDGTGSITTSPGILIDLDGDGLLGFVELNDYINEFLNEFENKDVPFWTEVVAKRSGFNESVEVFDLVSAINNGGQATDNTVVLLRRPDTSATGFGFDGNAILLEVVFQAVGAGSSAITIDQASGILETFTDINSDIKTFGAGQLVTSTVTVN